MLTVLFSTRNGSKTLAVMLDAFCRLEAPHGGWKIVAVDNGSTDDTKAVIESFRDTLPLAYVFEPAAGKNAALNTGLAAAKGDLVVLTDDDIVPRADWLVQLRSAADAHPDHAVFGGRIVARWAHPPEPWIQWVHHPVVYAVSDPALKDGPIEPSLVFGPNMAIRASVFASGIRFDPAIGPRAGQYAMGSETELVTRAAGAGHKAWHVAGAVVEHMVRASQMERDWVLARAVRFGRGQFRLFSRPTADTPRWFGVPRHLYREVITAWITLARARLYGNAERVFKASWRLNVCRGRLIEARNVRDEARARA